MEYICQISVTWNHGLKSFSLRLIDANHFVHYRFYRQFFQFSLYFLLSVICFTLRPGPPSAESIQNTTEIPEINDVTSGKYKYTGDRGDDRRRKRYTNNSETSTQLIDNYIRNDENSTSSLHEIYTTQIPPVETNIYNNTINSRLFNQTSFSEVRRMKKNSKLRHKYEYQY